MSEMICAGCNVRPPWEHRCHGGTCACHDCNESIIRSEPAAETKLFEVTEEERRIIRRLKSLARDWPSTLWLFSAAGHLKVMKAPGGKRIYTAEIPGRGGGGSDPSYIITEIDIPND